MEEGKKVTVRDRPGSRRIAGIDPRELNEMGKRLVNRLVMLIRTSKIHSIDNLAMVHTLDFFLKSANSLFEKAGVIYLQGDRDQIYINEYRLKVDPTVYQNGVMLIKELNQRGSGGLLIKERLDKEDLKKFVVLFNRFDKLDKEIALDILSKEISKAGIKGIEFLPIQKFYDEGISLPLISKDKFSYAMKVYTKMLVAIKRIVSKGREVRPIDRLKLTKILQALIDLSFDEGFYFPSLLTLKSLVNYPLAHPANICIISIYFAKSLGFSKKLLMEIGFSALYIDIGMAHIPEDIRKKSDLSEEERREIESHPFKSFMEILRIGAFNDGIKKRLISAFEHHKTYDGKGYPAVLRPSPPHLFSRILTIVDSYDALTTARGYREAYLPDQALAIMLKESGKKFDPILMKEFVNLLGIYPVGTLLELDTGELAISFYSSPDPDKIDRPVVKIITDPYGNRIEPIVFDLSKKGSDGSYLRSIVRTLDPELYNVRVPFFFLET